MQRRTFIKDSALTVIGISAFGALHWNGKSFEADTPTTTDILGPFYRPGAPLRTNLRIAGSKGMPIVLKGKIFREDGRTPIKDAFVEIWHCDENEQYDNTSDQYHYRGGQKSKSNGGYEFKTILPVPYQAVPNNEATWRPAHIHMRVSVPDQQDLITQIYFKDGKYVDTDRWASAPQATNRILKMNRKDSGESEIIFNVVMSKDIPLEKKVYDTITGLYDIGDNNFIEFSKNDDLLFMKQNGQLAAALKYMGNNKFEGGEGFPKAFFELQMNGTVKVVVDTEIPTATTYHGTRFLVYK